MNVGVVYHHSMLILDLLDKAKERDSQGIWWFQPSLLRNLRLPEWLFILILFLMTKYLHAVMRVQYNVSMYVHNEEFLNQTHMSIISHIDFYVRHVKGIFYLEIYDHHHWL